MSTNKLIKNPRKNGGGELLEKMKYRSYAVLIHLVIPALPDRQACCQESEKSF